MSVSVDATFQARIEAAVYGALYLVEMAFTGGTLRVTNYPVDLSVNVGAGAVTWTGVGALAGVSDLRESEDGRAQRVDLTLSQVLSSNLALALGSVSTYQGRDVSIYVGVMNDAFAVVGTPTLRFAGYMDRVRIERDGSVGKVIMECQSGAHDVRSNPAGLRMNDAQHQSLFPGERGFEYVAGLIGKPQQWLSARFQTLP